MIISLHFFSTGSLTKREIKGDPFTPEDIYVPSDPREVDGGIVVEYAVVKTSAEGTPVAVPSTVLAKVTEEKAKEIGQKIGAKVVGAKPKPPPVKILPTKAAQTGGQDGGMIAGVVVAVGITIIIAAVAVWYLR